jgi:hypothetical protein
MEYDIKKDYRGTVFEVKRYYKKGTEILHREDGPAVEWADGSKFWYIKGMLHRTDGPAVESRGTRGWFINGERLSPEKEAILNKWWNKKNAI